MASSSPHSFDVLYAAWRHAEQAAVIAEQRWIDALDRSTSTEKEISLRRSELIEARKASRTIFKQAMNIAKTNSHLTSTNAFSELKSNQSNSL